MANAAVTIPGQDFQEGDEKLLMEHLRRVGELRGGAYAVHTHLSELKATNRKPHFIRIASRSFEGLEHAYEAALFRMTNQDLILICRDVPIEELDEAIFKVRSLFADDPLTAAEEGSIDDTFTTWYDLAQEDDLANFKEIVADLTVEAERLREEHEKARKAAEAAKGMVGDPLTPKNLAAINQQLQGSRISDLVRQQPAVHVLPPKTGEILFREFFVSMSDLQKRIAPDINLFSSTWLFNYLTETLDKRMLIIMGRRDFAKSNDSVSINLNISTVLSQEFGHFHRIVGDNAERVVIEIQLSDVFSDVSGFHFARESLQSRGYRVLVDGLNPLSLQFFDPGILQADYVKIAWGPEFAGEVSPERMGEMKKVVRSCGKEAVILARVDSEEAIAWGIMLGIFKFQGYFVDKLVERMIAKGIIGKEEG